MEADPLYKEEIYACILELKDENKAVSLKNIINKMTEFIIRTEEGKDISIVKRLWTNRVIRCATFMNMQLKNSKTDWRMIENGLTSLKQSPSASNSTSSISTNSITTTTTSSSNSNINKNYKLSIDEKQQIIENYDSIPENEMWKLNSGKLVEKQMKALAEQSIFCHPVHSFILDPFDPVWKSYFTKKELDEIIIYNQKKLPSFPIHLNQTVDSFKNIDSVQDFYSQAIKQLSETITTNDHDKKWILHSIINNMDIYNYNLLNNNNNMSEADILNKIWSFLYKGFYHGPIEAKLGEASSSSSSLNQNLLRSLEINNPRKRKATGRKVDILFKYDQMELGCVEVGKCNDITDDKYINDAMKKTPVVLKDILSAMVNNDEELKNKLSSIGIIIMGLKIQLLIMDVPAGKVCRLTKTDLFNFPTSVEKIYQELKLLFDIIYKAKLMMEENINIIKNHIPNKTVSLPTTSELHLVIPPSFAPNTYASKKSRTSDNV